MSDAVVAPSDQPATPIRLLAPSEAEAAIEALPAPLRGQAKLAKFRGKPGETLSLAGEAGPELVLAGVGESGSAMALRALPARLPAGLYALAPREGGPGQGPGPAAAALAFALGAYRFDRYKKDRGEAGARLVCPEGVDLAELRAVSHACALARDMINTPAGDMGALQIETIAREVAHAFDASITAPVGDALIEAGYPAVHAVGRAATPERAPRFIEIRWGDADAGRPLVALIGKGVVFDTGGLDIKPAAGMRTMKKDMGGAAHALALGRMVMAARLPIRLAVLLPVAENAIAGDAMRPGDVLNSRKGLTIEVGNTDAEGRLILADALARAAELDPDLTIDLATLTGAARTAVGPEIAPFYTDDEALAGAIEAAAREAEDPVWRMPLWAPYDAALDSDIADVKNDPDAWAQAGSITAALFLKRFAPAGAWAHFDIFAWNGRGRPGWPSGAEAQAIRGLFRMLKTRYA
jgi:leucyl aminopeptidase